MKRQVLRAAFFLGLSTATSIFFLNCGAGRIDGITANKNWTPESTIREEINFSSFRFFIGGWFPPPGKPYWSDDMTFTLRDDVLMVDSKTFDELCFKPTYTLGDEDRITILNLIKDLEIVVAKDIHPVADAGSKTINFKLIDGTESLVHLRQTGANNGDNLAKNGEELADFLQNLNKKIPVACK